MMDEYKVGSVADSISRGKASSGLLSKLFSDAPTGYAIQYIPVKQQEVKQEVKFGSPVHKSVMEQLGVKSNNVPEKRKKNEGTETGKRKKRKIEVFDNAGTEVMGALKKKKSKIELNFIDESRLLPDELAELKKKKKKMKSGCSSSEIEPEVNIKTQQACEDGKKKKKRALIPEFTELPEAKPLQKKRKRHKEISDAAGEGCAMEIESEKEVKFHLFLETQEHEDKLRTDDSEDEDEEKLSNKQCALKRLEKKRLKEIKLQCVDEEQNAHTVFVGNVPNDINKKKLKKFFSKYGAVKSVRLRCAPLADPRVPKKVAIIKQKYHPERSNIHAFVCFEDVESTHKALEANGMLIGEHHIMVDLQNNRQAHDQKKAVFIGNLPFAAEEDDLWKLFEPCGAINNIRIVRDKVTGVGKGFAYINFESADAVELALKLDGEELKSRKLRISRYARKPIGKFVNKQILHKTGFRKNTRVESTTKQRKDVKETFKDKWKVKKTAQRADRAQTKVIKKKIKASYQGQKIAEKRKPKKNKKKINRGELKKKILVNKLGLSPKINKSSKKVTFKFSSS